MITAELLSDKVLRILENVAETDAVRKNPNLRLFDLQVLDSMKTVELIVALEQEFGVVISPAEFDREDWATPRELVADLERRLAA